jgi:hypothetical protein
MKAGLTKVDITATLTLTAEEVAVLHHITLYESGEFFRRAATTAFPRERLEAVCAALKEQTRLIMRASAEKQNDIFRECPELHSKDWPK